MRHKALVCALVLLMPTLLFSQEISRLVVDALDTRPTVVRTGEPIIQSYKVSYLNSKDLTGRITEEVIILEDEMLPDNLPASWGDFQIINWQITDPIIKTGESTDEYIRYITLTLRIINPEKKNYPIPRLTVPWVLIDTGKNMQDADQRESESQPSSISVQYISTVPDNPNFGIRDEINLGDFSGKVSMFWYLSRVIFPVVALLSLFFAMISIGSLKRSKLVVAEAELGLGADDLQTNLTEVKQISFNKAYRNFYKELRKVEDGVVPIDPVRFQYVLRSLLVSKLEKINPGDTTAGGIGEYINKNIRPGIYRDSLIYLQENLEKCQTSVESGFSCNIGREDIPVMSGSALFLKRRWRVISHMLIVPFILWDLGLRISSGVYEYTRKFSKKEK